MKLFQLLPILLMGFIFSGCQTPPGDGGSSASSAQVPVQGAQTVGRNQGQAAAAETGSATASVQPVIINALAARKVTIRADGRGGTQVDVEGSDNAEVTVDGASFGNYTSGNENNVQADVSSGGGSASGAGDSTRSGDRGGN